MHIDLHVHSSVSADGEIPPPELVRMAAKAGLSHIAIADHNRVDAVGPAIAAAADTDVTVIPCVELDCMYSDLNLHILGYFVDHTDTRFAELWRGIAAQDTAASGRRLELARRLGLSIDEDTARRLARDGIVTGELIAAIALADPANAGSGVLAPYRPGGARADNPYVNFYWDYCSAGKPAHVGVAYMPLEQAIALVRDTGGVPVLAHPGQSLRGSETAVEGIAKHGVAGLEAFSSYHSPDECRLWAEAAGENSMFITCGSDFHGKTKPAIRLGSHGAGSREDAILRTLLSHGEK